MNIRRLINQIIAFACLTMMSACYNYDGDIVEQVNTGDCYINLAISVNNGNKYSTRVGEIPAGGEDGDGREAGFERENTVTGITLILYKDATGINTSSDPTLDLVRYFPVTERATGTMPIEVTYITGNQPLGKHSLDLKGTYHAIVIANAPEVAVSLVEGTSTLSDVRDATLNTIYVGDPTKSADNCIHFAMSSEQDNTIDFGSVTATNLDGTAHTDGQDMLFDLTDQPIVIERMAARIDFWAANSNGYKTSTDNAAYTIPGYEYDVTGSTTDKFVVTGIVPFNLANGHATYGSEYLLKRLRSNVADASTTSYLASETTTNYVIDPKTDDKTTSETPTLTSSLGNIYTLISNNTIDNPTDNPYYHSMEAMYASSSKISISSSENVVVAYPMENCLLPESKLYYHATGIAIVGYYYTNGTGTGTRMVYMGYLRHQGESTSYDIHPSTTPLATDATMGTTTAMNFGIVRNNIYRVSIEGISPLGGKLSLKIAVHDWRHVEHPIIYM